MPTDPPILDYAKPVPSHKARTVVMWVILLLVIVVMILLVFWVFKKIFAGS